MKTGSILLTHAYKRAWMSVAGLCLCICFPWLSSTLLIYPVKAARMCLRSAHYCKIKRSWPDRALPRKTQNLLIEKRLSKVLGTGAHSAYQTHSILPHTGSRLSSTVGTLLYNSDNTTVILPVSVTFVTSVLKASILLAHRAHLIQQAPEETSPFF